MVISPPSEDVSVKPEVVHSLSFSNRGFEGNPVSLGILAFLDLPGVYQKQNKQQVNWQSSPEIKYKESPNN